MNTTILKPTCWYAKLQSTPCCNGDGEPVTDKKAGDAYEKGGGLTAAGTRP